MKNLRDYQEAFKSDIYNSWESFTNVLAVLPTGMGKCHPKGTRILLYSGKTINVEDIRQGDILMGPDSTPRKVLSTCKGREEIFKIKPVKGDDWSCNKSHVLSLRHTETGNITNITVEQYLSKSKNFKHLHKLWRTGVEFPQREIDYDPYMLGLYLAEGCYSHSMITTPEPEIKNYIEEWSERHRQLIRVAQGRGCEQIYFKTKEGKWHSNIIGNLRKFCTSKDDRWIPDDYLYNCSQVRLQLLAGLIDGDGHYGSGCYEIATKYSKLKDDIVYLCRSLGFSATWRIKMSNYKGYEHFIIVISGELSKIPCIVERKKAGLRLQKKNVLNTGFTLESQGEDDYYGFELDGDHLYLLGDFTVTHNTVTFCSIAIDYAVKRLDKYPTAIIVHRKELVQQISLTLAGEGIVHNIIAPRNVILQIITAQRRVHRKQFYDYNAPITVVSVDTLNARATRHEKWAKTIRLWITDEATHLLKDNKWGKAVALFTNAMGLGVTATPERLDKKGLGSHADGVFDVMVEGPDVKWGIEKGYLCKWKAVVPESDYLNYIKDPGGRDFTSKEMESAARESHIIGDVVQEYIKWALGKQAILFAPTISVGQDMERKFIDAGIPAKLLTGNTPALDRLQSLLDFQEKKIKVLLNVDLFDEGLDVPGIEVVQHARPTMSKSKYKQMNGRGLRPAKGKDYLLILDHVGNIQRHGRPDKKEKWTLDRIAKKRKSISLLRYCENPMCCAPYERELKECPYCGTAAITVTRSEGGGRTPPEQVDGDLVLMDPDTLDEMYKATILESPEQVGSRVAYAAGGPAGIRAMKNQQIRIDTQKKLIDTIALWAGEQTYKELEDREIHKLFYITFGKTIAESLSEPTLKMEATIDEITKA